MYNKILIIILLIIPSSLFVLALPGALKADDNYQSMICNEYLTDQNRRAIVASWK